MRSADKTILLILPAVVLVIGFWLLVISPKQKEAGDLGTEVAGLQSELAAAQGRSAEGLVARADFRSDYADLVELGGAAPEDGGQATLVYDISELGQRNDVRFRSFAVTAGSDPLAAAATVTTAPTDATPTEAVAAVLPIGATVGPAGLPVTPYDFNFRGNFFDVSDFFADLDKQVEVSQRKVDPKVNGRLLTINGFALTADPTKGFPRVQSDFSVTSYIVPPAEGIQAGADPSGPSPVEPTAAVASTDAPAVAPTAGVTP